MTTSILLNWALIAISLFNTILLLWLALTVWLNAEQRSPGVWLATGGFLLGAAFFVSHSALLLRNGDLFLTPGALPWFVMGLAPVVLLPAAWYLVILWHAGYWEKPNVNLHRRHRRWFWLLMLVVVAAMGSLALMGIPYLPWFHRLSPIIWPERELLRYPIFGIPLATVAFPFYVLLSMALSLDAIRHPEPSRRIMGDEARNRARPWLVVASILLLLVAIVVAVVILWTIPNTRTGSGYYVFYQGTLNTLGLQDLLAQGLIALVVLMLGQAMAAYELFTGKALPRRELTRQWHRAVVLAAGFGVVVGGLLVWGRPPIYVALPSALLIATFAALSGWRIFAEWDRSMQQLRPFVSSQRWYDILTTASATNTPDPFQALCHDLLATTVAYLIPTGPLAPFVQAQSYPADRKIPEIGSLTQKLPKETLITAIDAQSYNGCVWAIPLWGQRGRIGIMLAGPRRDGSLYAREEIEIARATGERLIDAEASLALSQRLMRLQREHMAATQLLDQRTRRVLHDEVAPLIHTAMLSLAAGEEQSQIMAQLSRAHHEISGLLRELPAIITPDISRLGFIPALQRTVQETFSRSFDVIHWQIDENAARALNQLNPQAQEALYFAARELVRNAAKHAFPGDEDITRQLTVRASCTGHDVQLIIEDNGTGLLARAGSEAGHGISLHGALMAVAGGELALESLPGQYTRGILQIPTDGRQ
jgi:two-component sensor histidine kinase